MNKRIISLMLAVVMLLSSVSICCGAAAPETDFFESDYMAPRWMIALIFAEIFDYDESRYIYENAREYKDVPEDAYYAKAVSWMGQTGILITFTQQLSVLQQRYRTGFCRGFKG